MKLITLQKAAQFAKMIFFAALTACTIAVMLHAVQFFTEKIRLVNVPIRVEIIEPLNPVV